MMINISGDYPRMLRAHDLAAYLNISRSGAYKLMHSDGFPVLHIGRRMVVPQEKLIEWLDHQLST